MNAAAVAIAANKLKELEAALLWMRQHRNTDHVHPVNDAQAMTW